MFGIDQKKKAKMLGAVDSGAVRYLGGHKAYAQPVLSEIYFYEDGFEIETNRIFVRYSTIKDITNSNKIDRETERLAYGSVVIPLGLVYRWKQNHVYTVIEYNDGFDTQKIILDFEKGTNYVQSLIYKKMLEYRKSTEQNKKSESDTTSHSPIRNTAEIKKLESDTSSHSPIRF